MTEAIMKFPLSLVTLAITGSSPTVNVFWPMTSNSGRQRSIAGRGPAATMNSLAASAASGRPNTGAETMVWPCSRCLSVRLRDSAALMVLMET